MIIQCVQSERLHKYQTLRLTDLPEHGIIAVSGDNETGKSAIGEIVCFALFGRTYVFGEERIGKLVNWGAGQGLVTLRFRAKGRDYEVTRHLARDGERSARIHCLDDPESSLVRGTEAVTSEVERILGYGFAEYTEAFYLAEREITTPHPRSRAVKTMVGIAPLEECAAQLEQDVTRDEATARQLEGRIAEVRAGLEALGTEHERLDELESKLTQVREQEREGGARLSALVSSGEGYCDVCRGRRSLNFRRWLANLLSTILLLAALLGVALWFLLRYKPDLWPIPDLRSFLDAIVAGLGVSLADAGTYAAIVTCVLLLLSWLWMLSLGLGTRRRRSRARRLAEELDLVDDMEPGPGHTRLIDDAVLDADSARMDALPLVDKPDSERRSRLRQRVLGLTASAEEVRAALRHETAWMDKRLEQLISQRDEGEMALGRARGNQERHRELSAELTDLDVQLSTLLERIAVGRLACNLLGGAAGRMSERFRRRLRDMVSRALPQFTEGRYEHLQVDEGLQVRVYSGDKRNLLDLDEISSGTQRQIMLALRLGMAQELVSRVVEDDQFVFLDEPFAFFDSARMRGALKALSELGGDLVQYWVVAQRFPQDVRLGLEIVCGGHPDTLTVGRPDTD